ncbi:MAG: SpoIIE family protein phosphatase [Bacteroidota bacterium]
MSSKSTTIFKQLLLNIILPLILTIMAFSYISYYYNRQKLEESYANERKLIVDQVKTLITFYDYSMHLHEDEFNHRMNKVALLWRDYFKSHDPISSDLYLSSIRLGMDTTKEFVYLIDRKGEIRNTTFRKDLHLNFYKIDSNFRNFFEKRFRDTAFLADRFGFEMNTGKIKKYGYITTIDTNYIIELGFASQKANELKQMLENKVSEIASKFSEIKKIQLLEQILNVATINVKDKRYNKWIDSAILTKKNVRIIDPQADDDFIVDFIYLPIMNASLYDAYVINIVSDKSKEKELIQNEIKKFLLIFLFTITPLIAIVSYRARVITRPIKILTEKVGIISSGKLDERVNLESNNEIGLLSENFNKMVIQLQVSYANLEQKVEERTAEVVQQKHLVEEKQKEILDSIAYAKRLQEAILPPQEMINNNFPENFIYYQPKDIVAGDFYWAEKVDDCVFIAAADSTGHGVPGAMVSVVCSNALNRAVKEFKLTETGKILDKTRELVIETFTKSNADVKDGMDISLLCINKKINKAFWSGANNPLWMLKENTIIEITADKQPIGKSDLQKPFTTHEIPLNTTTTFYLFTDGYADQFGGPKGKKFKYKQFQEVLLSLQDKTMNEQLKVVRQKFESWRGALEQIDDVCVIGLEV